jgi:hypothetical protein
MPAWTARPVASAPPHQHHRLKPPPRLAPTRQVPPVFAIHGLPKTPDEGDKYNGPGSAITRQELHALFDVIGTPAWACIEGVQSPSWRGYLLKIRGRAPMLFRWAAQQSRQGARLP